MSAGAFVSVEEYLYPNLKVVPELRSNTAETRYRLPDVSVLLSAPPAKYLLEPAHIAVEILSEDDKMTKVVEKPAEYEAKGVGHIWLVDPRLRLMSVYRSGDLKRRRVEGRRDRIVARRRFRRMRIIAARGRRQATVWLSRLRPGPPD